MNTSLRGELVAMQAEDHRVRDELAAEGILGEGYEPRMERVHLHNAARLESIVAEFGWPGRALVEEDGAEAAWQILQHAISRPDLMRAYLPLLNQAAKKGDIPEWQPAYVLDRIRFFEGKPQVYATQYDWDEQGFSQLWTVEEPEGVNDRRRSVGLPPLAETGARARVQKPLPLEEVQARRKAMDEWARSVGWRE
jgi:hypothetical protein